MHSRVAIIGGTGIQLHGDFQILEPIALASTPFGQPSGDLQRYKVSNREVLLLPRHGIGHRLMASEINYRANIYALKKLGVEQVIAVCAVGSMKDSIEPSSFVVPDQIYDNTKRRVSTFFGDGIAAYVSMASPFCERLNKHLCNLARGCATKTNKITIHDGGTYLCIEGPNFASQAESNFYRQNLGADIIGMTAATEACLAREAGMCYTVLACVSDYDCWHPNYGKVSVKAVLQNVHKNQENTNHILATALPQLATMQTDRQTDCGCANSLANAIATNSKHISTAAQKRLQPLLEKGS